MEINNLHGLLVLKLKSLLDVERQLVKSVPKMAKKANDEELAKALDAHLEETRGHVERLEQAFKIMDIPARTITVEGIRGIIEDTEWVMKNVEGPEALDAALLAAAQYIEHYEVAGYRTMSEWAQVLGYDEIAVLMQQTLQEEEKSIEDLSNLAKAKINGKAVAFIDSTG